MMRADLWTQDDLRGDDGEGPSNDDDLLAEQAARQSRSSSSTGSTWAAFCGSATTRVSRQVDRGETCVVSKRARSAAT